MLDQYTMDTSELYVADLAHSDAAQIWGQTLPGDGSPTAGWKEKLAAIGREYQMSCRFALMRILHSRAMAFGQPEEGYQVRVGQEDLTFRDITMAHAQCLTPAESRDYIRYLLQLAAAAPQGDAGLHEALIARAWYDLDSANEASEAQLSPKILSDPEKLEKSRAKFARTNRKKYGARLTRQEALQLGHILGFTWQEMRWFLLRVFDTDDGFRLNSSGDLIEVYCFHMGRSWQTAEALKQAYAAQTENIPKREDMDRSRNWTARVAGGLSEQLEQWQIAPDTADEQFLNWLTEQAPGLDVPSHTARRVYRNLAVYAYKLMHGKSMVPEEEEFLDKLQALCRLEEESIDVRFYLYRDGEISPERCEDIAKDLLRGNSEFAESENPDNAKAWAALTARPDGTLSSTYGVVNESRSRVRDLLLGQAETQKGDLLYLLWFVLNMVWYDATEPDADTLCCRVFDLKDGAYLLLEAAGLPDFYPPHLMEQGMLMSILYGGQAGCNPIEVYGELLQCVKATRSRRKKGE